MLQNNSSLVTKTQKQVSMHRRTHSSSDYEITSRLAKNRQISPKTSISPKESNYELTTNPNTGQGFLDAVKKKSQEIQKEIIIEPLDMTPEQQRILAGGAKYSNENLNFGKNIKNSNPTFFNTFSQLFNPGHPAKETVVEKYKKQLEDQKISTIIEKNDFLSNEDSSFNDLDKLSPINRNSSEYIPKNENERRPSFRKKKFHSNSQDLDIGRNLVNCGNLLNQRLATHSKNSPSQQVFTIYLKDPNKNEKQLDKIINFLKVTKKVPEVNLQGLQNKSLKYTQSQTGLLQNHSLNNQNSSNNQNNNNNQNFNDIVKNLEKRVFLLENEVLNLRAENNNLKQNNTSLTKKLQDMGYLDSENMIQVLFFQAFLVLFFNFLITCTEK